MDRLFPQLNFPAALLLCLALTACNPSPAPDQSNDGDTDNRLAVTPEESFARLRSAFPWEKYVSNAYLPTPSESSSTTSPLNPIRKLSVALPWLQNDQTPALWLGLSRGYFEAEGLELEIIPGGPGRDNLLLLLGGNVDVSIVSSTTGVIRMLASETGGEVVAVAALQKDYPYAYIALDRTIPKTQTSGRTPTADDFRGKTLGMTQGGELFLSFALEKLGLEKDDITIRKAGSSLVPLTTDVFDFYTTMADNNPRKLEAMGFQNWMLWEFREHGWVDYHNVITVRPDFLETQPETVRAFLRALDRSLRDLLAEQPLSIAEEILPFVAETGLTPPLIARRIELQRPITVAIPEEPILHMTEERWIEAAAILWRYGAIDLPKSRSLPQP